MKIYYYGESYQSLNRAASAYQSLIMGLDNIELSIFHQDGDISAAEEADILILHTFPGTIEKIYNLYPQIREKYVIAYLVWETSDLPVPWQQGIKLVQEVWTPSKYCIEIFRKYHDRIIYIPHVVERDIFCSDGDRSFIKRIVRYEEGYIYYLVIASTVDKRKNVKSLVDAFESISHKIKNARLIVKSCWSSDPIKYTDNPNIIYLREDFTHEQLNALYEIADAVVSTHHSEGWGFTLSDAMIFKVPVIATGYSGNLEYMSEENSFLIDYDEYCVRKEDSGFPFLEQMRWAYPKSKDINEKLILLYDNLYKSIIRKKVNKASDDIKKFSKESVATLIKNRFDEIRIGYL